MSESSAPLDLPLSGDESESDEAHRLLVREMGRVLDGLVRLRFVAALLLGGFAVAFSLTDIAAWRIWLLGCTAAALAGMAFYDLWTFQRHPLTPARQTYLLFGVLVLHTVMILVTGGIRSPFIVLYLVLTTVGALSLGRLGSLLVLVIPAVAMIWALTVLDALGRGPSHFEWFGVAGAASRAHVWFFAAVLTLALAIGSTIALAHRRALDRSIRRSAISAREALATLAERNRGLQELSGTLAHELKNPLASIQGLAGLLVRKLPEGSREAEQMGVLLAEARRMAGILDEFLNFSRPVGGLAVRSVDPARLVQDVAALHEGLAEQRAVELQVVAERTPPLRCDPRKVQQVLVNLLQNALEASPRGTVVVLRARPGEGGGVEFQVEDRGCGLAPEVRDRLFRPGVTTKPAGTGLGLVVARSIAEQHGGTLTLADRPGGGCLARCAIPAELPVPTGEPAAEPVPAPAGGET
ncbi:MAG: HAMP domain-containing histidine kinase [Deltaproteobacteria bacterium]|nr:HAMP domain-containing histidine kinase [Deltaproteobacteria bacterium]